MNKGTPDLKYLEKKGNSRFSLVKENITPYLYISDTDFYYLPVGEIYQELSDSPELGRLEKIKQLGTVGASWNVGSQEQNRFFHSFITAAMMDIILYRNKFSEYERKKGISSGLYHDVGMMPFSDQGKLFKPDDYEEENLNVKVIKESSAIKEKLEKFNISIDDLINTINGKGIAGKLLNSKDGIDADNLSYLAIDQQHLDLGFHSYSYHEEQLINLKKEKGLFEQYNNIRYIDRKWVFDNPDLLLKLVKFRALMYQNVYHNPLHRSKVAFLSNLLKDSEHNLDELLEWDDWQFVEWFKDRFGERKEQMFFLETFHPFIEIGREYDLTKLHQLKNNFEKDNTLVEYMKPPRDALENYVLYKNKVRLLTEIPQYSKQTEEIRNIINGLNYIGIYKCTDKTVRFN
jgi:HD superfamily phosphohydrolase